MSPIPPRNNCDCGGGGGGDCCESISIVDSDGNELDVQPDGSINVNAAVVFPPSIDVTIVDPLPLPVTGTVCIDDCGESITVDDGGLSLTVDGTVSVDNFPASVEISNDVGNPIPVNGTVCIDDCGGSITVDDGGGSITVDGTVAIGNFPASVEVSNDVGNPLPISKDTSVNALGNPIWTQISDGTTPLDIVNAGAATGAAVVQLAANAQLMDVAAWAPFSDHFVMVGGLVSGTGFGGAAAITAGGRAWLVHLTDAAGAAFGVTGSPLIIGDGGASISIDDNGGSITVDGTVAVSNFPASVEVSNDVGSPLPVSDAGGSLTVDDGGGSITVDGTVSAAEAKAEDALAVTGDMGIPVLGVRNDAAATLTSGNGDYSWLATDAAGRVGIADLGGSITVDTAAVTVQGSGQATIGVAASTPMTGTPTAGVSIIASEANTAPIFVGVAGVTITTGRRLPIGATIDIPQTTSLATIAFISSAAGQNVSWVYA